MNTFAHRKTLVLVAAAALPAIALMPVQATADTGDAPGADNRGMSGKSFSHASGPLVDLRTDTDDPTDGVKAQAVFVRSSHASLSGLRLKGFDSSLAGKTLGVHIHTGPCVEGDGDAAGPHYNRDVDTGREPVRTTPFTEVWLDVTVNDRGQGYAGSVVPFELPADKAKALVVHEKETDDTGDAGDRLACLPLDLE